MKKKRRPTPIDAIHEHLALASSYIDDGAFVTAANHLTKLAAYILEYHEHRSRILDEMRAAFPPKTKRS